ncbi:MAG: hypothetical protein HKO58_04555 [Gammaproteobacteria bacterium]|nr:hypothetical protein [Gammaproteobacteria bacterium]
MSVSIAQLWLPILLGGVFAWVASSIIHMVLKYHNHDYNELTNENEVSAALGNSSPKPGIYTLPYCTDMKKMAEESMQQKFTKGPVAMISVFDNGMPPMGKLMGLQIGYFLLGCALIAYVASLVLPSGTEYMRVFHVVGEVAFLTFGFASIPYSIWYGHPWAVTGRFLLDAIIYAAVVAGTFAWLWPAAA